jgi:hypothetical protein
MRPLLASLGLTASKPEVAQDGPGRVAFQPLDLTPPDQDVPPLAELVNAGILSPEEAHAILPMSARAPTAKGAEIKRSAPPEPSQTDPLDQLAAILSRV